MDQATKLSVVALGLFVVAVIWWCVRSGQREQRREKAKAWAKAQVTPAMVPVGRDGGQRATERSGPTVPPPRTGKHDGADVGAVSVSDLLARAVQAGDPVRLNWPQEDLDEHGRVRPCMEDGFPTGVLPLVRDDKPAWQVPSSMDSEGTTSA